MRARKTTMIAATVLLVASMGTGASGAENGPDLPVSPSGKTQIKGDLKTLEDLERYAKAVPLKKVPGASLTNVPDDVQELANALWDEQPAGFGDVQWDEASSTATVWWHGTAPEAVQGNVEALTTEARIASMTYSKADLVAAARSLLEQSVGDSGAAEVQTVAAKADGSGLEVTVALPPTGIAKRSAESARMQALDETESALQFSSDYPVEVVVGGEVSPAADDRKYTPAYPYAGGASIINGAGTFKACTSGWPVLINSPDPVVPRTYGMAFASHCVTNTASNVWTTWTTNSTRYFFGSQSLSTYRSGAADAAVLYNSPDRSGVSDPTKIYLPYIYVGPPTGASRYVITATVAPVIGANWCLSGAPSGTTCGNKINSTSVMADYGADYPMAGPLVRTASTDGLATVGQGDSGGPAHRIDAAGAARAQVAGIISGIQTIEGKTYICRMNNDGRKCSDVALISPTSLVQSKLNVRAMTASNFNE